MLKFPHHPYQTTTLPQPHLHARNPWVEKPESSTNSSCGSRSCQVIRNQLPQPTIEWFQPRDQKYCHHGPLLNQQVQPIIVPRHSPTSAVGTAQGSSGGLSTTGGIGNCGGQCIACETFCYYCLQVVFVAGILTGIALTIAGSVLHQSQRDGDLVVLMYIGVLLVLVCVLLLSIHCCVRRNVKERKRALRLTLMDNARRGVSSQADFMSVPVQDFTAEPPFRNSYTETNLNTFDCSDNPRPVLNVVSDSNMRFQSRLVPTSRFSSSRACSYDRRVHPTELPDRQHLDWATNSYPAAANRPMR